MASAHRSIGVHLRRFDRPWSRRAGERVRQNLDAFVAPAATCAFGSRATRAAASSSVTARSRSTAVHARRSRALRTRVGRRRVPRRDVSFAGGSNVADLARVPNVVALRARRHGVVAEGLVDDVDDHRSRWPRDPRPSRSRVAVKCRTPRGDVLELGGSVRRAGAARHARSSRARLSSFQRPSVLRFCVNPPPTVRFDVDATRRDREGARADDDAANEEHRDDENWRRGVARDAVGRVYPPPRGAPIFASETWPPASSVSRDVLCVFGDDADQCDGHHRRPRRDSSTVSRRADGGETRGGGIVGSASSSSRR